MWVLTIVFVVYTNFSRSQALQSVVSLPVPFQTEQACIRHAENVLQGHKDAIAKLNRFAKDHSNFTCTKDR